jgi:hypothetical protein
MRSTLLAICTAACLALAGAANAATMHFTAELNGPSETPPTTSTGTGMATATLDTNTKLFSYTVTYSGLTGPAVAAHFHMGMAGIAGPPVVPITGSLASPIMGSATLTDTQIGDLEAGKWYVNVHTAANKPGEIRGQVMIQQ